MANTLTLILIFIAALTIMARAEIPLRDPQRMLKYPHHTKVEKETVVGVAGARVVTLDLELLAKDFPQLRGKSAQQVSEIILGCVSFVSQAQANQSAVNTPITTDDRRTKAYRPLGYGRALVFECLNGLIEAKGAGSRMPLQKSHGNGLMDLVEALREDLIEHILRTVLRHAGYKAGTVGIYGVVDLGFDVIFADGSRVRAALALRQAHERSTPGRLTGRSGEPIEALLRRYGIVSDVGSLYYPHQTIDRHNVQASAEGALVDGGAVRIFNGQLVESPSQPDPDLRVPFELYGHHEGDFGRDRLQDKAAHLANEWLAGTMSFEQIEQEIKNFLSPLEGRYKTGCEPDLGS